VRSAVTVPNADLLKSEAKTADVPPLPWRFATCGSRIAAAGRARFALTAQLSRMRKNAGFFRVYFAQEVNYASFEPWKSSFAK
jgi:hypothetical protein